MALSQDIHFSQFDSSPLNLNPALSGNFNGQHRFVANHRNQWNSITVPYKTFSFSYDYKYDKALIKSSFFGIGFLVNADKAGDGDFGTSQIKISPAYHRLFNNDSNFVVSIGFNIAYNQHSINYDAFYFGNQFSGNRFNPNLPSYEVFENSTMSYFDFSTGVNLFYVYNNIPFNFGIALNHLNKPQQSFYENQTVELNSKFNLNINSVINLNEQFDAYPSFAFFKQGKFKEINIGGLFAYKTDDIRFRKIYFGAWTRAGDAIFVKLALDYLSFNFGISYDVNYSKLRVASNGRGGIELSIIYILEKSSPVDIKFHKQCPVFL